MAVLVFSGGHSLRVASPADAVVSLLTTEAGLIPLSWREFQSGDDRVLVNPQAVAYVVEDEPYEATFGKQFEAPDS